MIMKISDLKEAITPKGPAKITTGGRGSIANPAHSPSAYYEGDPAKFDFKAQKKNYEALKAALARSGKKLDYIGVARSATGPDTFVATGPGIVWQKYVPNNPQGAMNMIYINGVKLKLGDFLAHTPDGQVAVLGGLKSDVMLLLKKDVGGYVQTLVKETDKAGIEESFKRNKKVITRLVHNIVEYKPDILGTIGECEKLLASKGVRIPWFTKEVLIEKSMPKILKHLAEKLCYYNASVVQHGINEFAQHGVDISMDKVLTQKETIIKILLTTMKNSASRLQYDYTYILPRINDLKEMADWPELNVMKRSIASMLTSQKETVIRDLLTRIKEAIGYEHYLRDILSNIKTLKQAVDWPELDAMKRSISSM